MGYVRNKRYKLVFADEEFAGLEVVTRPLPIGDYLEMVALMDERPETLRQSKDKSVNILGIFAGALISWNLEADDGTPVPATLEGMTSQDYELCLEVIRAYIDAINGVPAPLDEPSPSGEPSLEASLPMEPLSQSLAS